MKFLSLRIISLYDKIVDFAVLFNDELHVYSKVRAAGGAFHEDKGLFLARIDTKLEQDQKSKLSSYKTLAIFHFNARVISALKLQLIFEYKLISLILLELEF